MNSPSHRAIHRRQFLGTGLLGTLGLALSPALQRLLAKEGPARRAKACIVIWLNGGPSHLDTFDPKPGGPTGGPFQAIDTAVPGLKFSQHLPKLAAQAKHLTVIRSMNSHEGDHDRGYHFLHTGNSREETVIHPTLGSIVAREWAAEDGDLPPFVALNGFAPEPGFFGVEFAPHFIPNIDAPLENIALPDGVSEDRLTRRLKALESFNSGVVSRVDATGIAQQKRFAAKALRFRKSPALKAFDLTQEKPETLTAYGVPTGDGADAASFGKACLLARRLVENGVRFVEVMLDGWDTHTDNFTQVQTLCGQLDPALAALTNDLHERGMLKDTLVLCLGEFGRTPLINPQQGRDHWNDAFSLVLAGGGVRGGQVIGSTDAKGEQVKDRMVQVPDLYASLFAAFGMDGNKSYRTPGGRPIKLADKGKVVQELFS